MKKQMEELLKKLKEKPIKTQVGELIKKLKEKLTKEQIKESIKKMKENIVRNRKKIVIGSTISVCMLVGIYFGMAAYFTNHFYFGSEINGISVSGKSVEEVNKQMATELSTYTLELKQKGGKTEQITAEEIGLKYKSDGQFKSLKDNQNPYEWVSAVFNSEATKLTEVISFDMEILKERLDRLDLFHSNIIEPKNPSFKYKDKGYEIVPEEIGSKVDKDILYKYVSEAIINEQKVIDLEAIDCYVKPKYTSNSPRILEVRDILNKYVSSKITYTFGEKKEILDGNIINSWLSVNENFEVIFDEGKAKEYIDKLSSSYNTVGKKRSFVTSTGKTISVGGGDYGRTINKTKESEALVAAIKEGQTIVKEPAYSQTIFSSGNSDIGNTYVEIDLTNQHLWFYKNGELITEGNIVTGNVSKNNTTPPGVYRLKYKQRNAILRGRDYASPVDFWMPFNGGIGIHDASWRSKFGGTIYKTNGSHGCINSPYYLAKEVFNNIQVGTPIVCYN